MLSAAERPAPASAEQHRRLKWMALLLLSLAAHVCLYLPFGREPTPMTSVGEVSMSVEIVLGVQEPAGPGPQPEQAQEPTAEPPKAEAETPPTDVAPTEPPPNETPPPVTEPPPPPTEPPAPVEEPPPAEPPARMQEAAPELPAPLVEAPPPPPVAIEVPEEPLAAQAPTPVAPSPPEPTVPTMQVMPLPKPAPPQAKPAKPVAPRARAPDKRQPETRGATRSDRNETRTRPPTANAAGGVGRGRSDMTANYRGMVAAHLARFKQFPPEARDRGSQGSATVTFALGGGGGVTSVSLVRGTGVGALDHEAVAMVRRASPFPAPPDGRAVRFTVPVSFRIQ